MIKYLLSTFLMVATLLSAQSSFAQKLPPEFGSSIEKMYVNPLNSKEIEFYIEFEPFFFPGDDKTADPGEHYSYIERIKSSGLDRLSLELAQSDFLRASKHIHVRNELLKVFPRWVAESYNLVLWGKLSLNRDQNSEPFYKGTLHQQIRHLTSGLNDHGSYDHYDTLSDSGTPTSIVTTFEDKLQIWKLAKVPFASESPKYPDDSSNGRYKAYLAERDLFNKRVDQYLTSSIYKRIPYRESSNQIGELMATYGLPTSAEKSTLKKSFLKGSIHIKILPEERAAMYAYKNEAGTKHYIVDQSKHISNDYKLFIHDLAKQSMVCAQFVSGEPCMCGSQFEGECYLGRFKIAGECNSSQNLASVTYPDGTVEDHLVKIQFENREELKRFLDENGIIKADSHPAISTPLSSR